MQLTDYRTMMQLRASFDRFLTETLGVGSGTYSFVIPVESKGATLFDSLYAADQRSLFNPQIYYPRAFDFLAPRDVVGKRAAAIDDTLFSGHTLGTIKAALEHRGLAVDTFAFAIDCTPAAPHHRDEALRAQTRSAVTLRDRETYKRYLMELRDWTTHARIPAAYDHLVLQVHTSRARVDELLGTLQHSARVLAYGRRAEQDCWSVLPAATEFWLGPYYDLAVAVPAKVRLWYDAHAELLSVVPMWTADPEADDSRPTEFDTIISSQIGDPLTRRRDRLDALSMAGRARMLAALTTLLPEIATARLERRHLDRTFTRPVSERLEAQLWSVISTRHEQPADEPMVARNEPQVIPYWSLAQEILDDVRNAYEEQTAPRFQRQSRGYTIHDLLQKYQQSFAVHAALDYLIDNNYLASFHGTTTTRDFTRGVRATETYDALAVQKLVATYALLAADQQVSTTETHKLFAILRHCFDMQLDGIALEPGLGGETARVLFGEEDREDITAILERSPLLTKAGNRQTRMYAHAPEHDADELTSDPVIERVYGRLRAVVNVVHNMPARLTPPQRATLLATMASEQRGLRLIAHDAGAMATAYGGALKKLGAPNLFEDVSVTAYRDQLGRAHKEGKNKVSLLQGAPEFLRDLPSTNDLYEKQLLAASAPPARWGHLLRFWKWYLDAFNATARLAIDAAKGAVPTEHFDQYVPQLWTVGPSLEQPYQESLRKTGQAWRDALSGHGITKSPEGLATRITPGQHWYAHYDLAASSKQVTDRAAWFAGSAVVLHDWARLFSCGGSSARETQAESGFLWSSEFGSLLHASAWATYMLYVLSELEQPETEWTPILCVCHDDAPTVGVGQSMARAAKTTKGVSRLSADVVAQHIRTYDRDSLQDRLFLLGEDALRAMDAAYPGVAIERTEYAQSLHLEQPLAMVPLDALLDRFLEALPVPTLRRSAPAQDDTPSAIR